jgi:cell wall-associated NlpC family hydrolase
MMRDRFVAAAKSYIGTPFHHQGRLPGVGLDCAGVVVCAAAACGMDIRDVRGYGRVPAGGMLEQAVLDHCDLVPLNEIRSGDIMLFCFLREPQHLAVFDNGMLIHAYSSVGKVVENSFDDVWRSRLRGCYRLKAMA